MSTPERKEFVPAAAQPRFRRDRRRRSAHAQGDSACNPDGTWFGSPPDSIREAGYNPNEPRDYRGRWTTGGAGSGQPTTSSIDISTGNSGAPIAPGLSPARSPLDHSPAPCFAQPRDEMFRPRSMMCGLNCWRCRPRPTAARPPQAIPCRQEPGTTPRSARLRLPQRAAPWLWALQTTGTNAHAAITGPNHRSQLTHLHHRRPQR